MGGRPFNQFVLSLIEDTILHVFGIYTTVDDISYTEDFGLSSQRPIQLQKPCINEKPPKDRKRNRNSDEEDFSEGTETVATPRKRDQRRENNLNDCLNTCIMEQSTALKKIIGILKENVEEIK